MTVSVITPTRLLPDRLEMLEELNQSLKNNDCDIEHVIVVDGTKQEFLPIDFCKSATIIYTERPVGQAAARNLGLAVAKGRWITSADDDDWLHPHSIDKRLEAINCNHGALWAAGYCTDDHKLDPAIVAPGPSAAGDIWRAWPSPSDSIPLGPTTLLVEANLLKKAGGWMGLPQAEDIGMMMAVTSMAPGVVIGSYVYHIRLHGGQMTKTKWFNDLELLSRKSAWERGEQILARTQIHIQQEALDLLVLAG
ncbi:glycosyltransferase [Cyanobium sp. HWJ4-Hawea]|uniref:glycosyltransferase family 2 protein n=1 Tax=Cyanobium sp. HWJ4-Hawea TaxID=2823713 RepID=UPI0020CD046F|nr:glycosyltransferase [Cyanobium sp. HWJ4-Hawea]MCP9810148.1 glycosyltransferase [Cyanobium sp. HWJ4-Hawea]